MLRLSMEQQTAIDLCCDMDERIVGVTGGAGTGKTLVLGYVYRELAKKYRVALVAPTGRAAKRIEELTQIGATTIHRLLKFPTPDDVFEDDHPINLPRHNRKNPIEYDVVIVDESSMVGNELYEFLMEALPSKATLRMFGDNNQLAPVEDSTAPPPFVEVLLQRPSVTLTFNFRSKDEIIGNATNILNGRMPQRNSRFEIMYSDDPIRELIRFVEDVKEFATDSHQIICPMRKGDKGTSRINPTLQVKYNPTGPMLRLDRVEERKDKKKPAPLTVRPGDKFLWTKNDYQLKVFNGEIGKIEWVHEEDGAIGLDCGDRLVTVPARLKTYSMYLGHMINYDPRKYIDLGYAITTHKSQGSEFDTVVYAICRQHYPLLNRRNLYTAVTRAKTRVIMITDPRAMSISLGRKG